MGGILGGGGRLAPQLAVVFAFADAMCHVCMSMAMCMATVHAFF